MKYFCAVLYLLAIYHYIRRRLASGEGIVTLGVCVSVCLVSAEPLLHAALVSAAKVMRCLVSMLISKWIAEMFMLCRKSIIFNISKSKSKVK